MPDTKAMSQLVSEAARARGPDFSAYTERDGGPWYLIAGYRGSWHDVTRVADTDTGDRDTARAFLLRMMGRDVPGYSFEITRQPAPGIKGALSWQFEGGPKGKRYGFTVWADEASRAFEPWARSIGMSPRNGWPIPTPTAI